MDPAEDRLVHCDCRLVHCDYTGLVFTGTRLGAYIGLHMDHTEDLLLDNQVNVSASNNVEKYTRNYCYR